MNVRGRQQGPLDLRVTKKRINRQRIAIKRVPGDGSGDISMNSLTRFAFPLFALLFISIGPIDSALARGVILGVNVSPDLNSVSIKKRGDLGRYNAFVIGSPNRLVIDFRSARLGRIKRRLRVAKPPLQEIRFGVRGSGARVVLDVGSSQTPTYNISLSGSEITIALNRNNNSRESLTPRPSRSVSNGSFSQRIPISGQASVETESSLFNKESTKAPLRQRLTSTVSVKRPSLLNKKDPKPHTIKSRIKPKPQPERVSLANRNTDFKVTEAGATERSLFLELANKKNPQEFYRIAFEFDPSKPSIGPIQVINSQGAISRFLASRVKPAVDRQPTVNLKKSPKPVESEVGHIEETDESPEPPVEKRKYGWGAKEPRKSSHRLKQSPERPVSSLNIRRSKPGSSSSDNTRGNVSSKERDKYTPMAFQKGKNPHSIDSIRIVTKGPATR